MNNEIEKVLRDLVEVAQERYCNLAYPERDFGQRLRDTITRAESLLARLSDERPVAWRHVYSNGDPLGWVDGPPGKYARDFVSATEGASIQLAYSRPQLAEVAPTLPSTPAEPAK